MDFHRRTEDLWRLVFVTLLVIISVESRGSGDLLNHRENVFSMEQLRGKVVLLVFGFTSCQDICPAEMARATIALNEMENSLGTVQPVFVTIDPDRDRPKVIARYLESFHPSFTGVSGDVKALSALAVRYGVTPARNKHHGNNSRIDHGYSTFILNTQGEIEVSVLPGLPPSHLAGLLSKFAEKMR